MCNGKQKMKDDGHENILPPITILVGSGRSGTTYLAGVLKQCLDIGISGEPKFVVPLYRKVEQYGDLTKKDNLYRLAKAIHRTPSFRHLNEVIGIDSSPEEIVARVKNHSYSGVLYATFDLLAEKRGKTRLGYKDPADLMEIDIIAKLFPTSKIINIVRDGRDVCMSLKKFNWGPTNTYAGIKYWKKGVNIWNEKSKKMEKNRAIMIKYEELIMNPDDVGKDIVEYIIGPEASDEVNKLVRYVKKTRKLDALYRWKRSMSAKDIRLCEQVAGQELEMLGYETRGNAEDKPFIAVRACYVLEDTIKRAANRLVVRKIRNI